MKRKGFAIIYVLIIIIPVAFMALSLLDINTVNYKMISNVVNAQQSYYLAEAGIEHGANRLKQLGYPTNYRETYYVYFDDLILNYALNYTGTSYAVVYLSCIQSLGKTSYSIDSTGYFGGCMRNIRKDINF